MVDLNNINGAIVEIDERELVNEGLEKLLGPGPGDTRSLSVATGPHQDRGAYSTYFNYQDPKLYANWAFGKEIQNNLTNIGYGYSAEVADFGRFVSIKITYSNPPTGKSASKTFLVVFDPDGKKGNIFQNSNRYRTFSGVSQAASYIKSCASALQSPTR